MLSFAQLYTSCTLLLCLIKQIPVSCYVGCFHIGFLYKNAVLLWFHLGKHPCEEYERGIQTVSCKKYGNHQWWNIDQVIAYNLDNGHVVFSSIWSHSKKICWLFVCVQHLFLESNVKKKTLQHATLGRQNYGQKLPFFESKTMVKLQMWDLMVPSETTITSRGLVKLRCTHNFGTESFIWISFNLILKSKNENLQSKLITLYHLIAL